MPMKITISSNDSSLIYISYVVDGQVKYFTLPLSGVKNPEEYLVIWLIAKSKHIFKAMPLDAPSLSLNKNLYEKYKDPLRAYVDIINNTNQYIRNLNNKDSAKRSSSQSAIVFNTDDQRYPNLFAYLSSRYPGRIHILHEPQNFDGESRSFINRPLNFSISYLVDFILANDISTVVSVNLDPLIRYLFAERINIFAVISYLGVKSIHLQNDPSELVEHGYLFRELANYDTTEFLIHSVLSKSYDSKSPGWIFPSPIMQDYSLPGESSTVDIEPEYDVVVISNSRYESTIAHKSSFLPVLEKLENPLVDLPLWYLSICKLLDSDTVCSITEISAKRHYFHWVFYHAAQYLKFDIINNISSGINLSVYGDTGWKYVCPERYKGYLSIEQLEPIYRCSSSLILLLNFGYTYLDHSGPIYDVIRNGSNWINVPVIASTPELSGLSHLEYSDYPQLNHLLSNYPPYRAKAESSKTRLRALYQSSTEQFVDSLFTSTSELSSSRFEFSHIEHSLLLDSCISSYLSKNIGSLMNYVYR